MRKATRTPPAPGGCEPRGIAAPTLTRGPHLPVGVAVSASGDDARMTATEAIERFTYYPNPARVRVAETLKFMAAMEEMWAAHAAAVWHEPR